MAKTGKAYGPIVLTANDILTGRIVWWSTRGWSEDFGRAVRASTRDEREALESIASIEELNCGVVGAVPVTLDDEGAPAGLRERRRLAGPSIPLPSDPADAIDFARVA